MLTIQIKLHWNRYHAHPWGQNPGRVREAEWPPSPWRLLRTLASAWFRSHPGENPCDALKELIEQLGADLPQIGIGRVSFAQTVHYQPNYEKGDKASATYGTTRHENHFAATGEPICFRWPEVRLDDAQHTLLAQLLEHVSYFGRADSICEAMLLTGDAALEGMEWCKPCLGPDGKPQKRIDPQCRDVFCPNPTDFRITDLWARRTKLEGYGLNVPEHLLNQMLASDMQVDGGCLVSYRMPDGWPHKWVMRTPRATKPVSKRIPSEGPKVAHYLCFSLQCRVPLLPKFIVPLSEIFRAAANHHLCKVYGDGATSFALFGHTNDRPSDAVGDHQHAFYLPMSKRGDASGFLSDLHIWCSYGFTQAEIEVLLRINRLAWGSGRFPVRPVLTALAKESLSEVPFSTGKKASRIWHSASPFVPPRYFYRGSRGKVTLKEKDRPEWQLVECLRAVGIHAPGEIRRLTMDDRQSTTGQEPWDIVRVPGEDDGFPEATSVAVHRPRSSSSRERERRVGMFFEIEFEEAVALRVPALGHSSHFGLGLFVPAAPGADARSSHD